MEKKYVAPEGMMKAGFAALSAREQQGNPPAYGAFLEAALRWQAENPPVPSKELADHLYSVFDDAGGCGNTRTAIRDVVQEWDRIAYLAAEPEIPEAVEKLMWDSKSGSYNAMPDATHNRQIIEAYELGLRAGRQG